MQKTQFKSNFRIKPNMALKKSHFLPLGQGKSNKVEEKRREEKEKKKKKRREEGRRKEEGEKKSKGMELVRNFCMDFGMNFCMDTCLEVWNTSFCV